MYGYSLAQWILFFFWYCFLGWIWECFYVSSINAWKTKKWQFINRGFLHGPAIPIYGFTAVFILLATMRVRDNTIAIYIFGALAATMMELVTGTVMEKLFHVKYWDYSHLPLNYKGHICFFVSLFWGFFSVLLVQVVHVPAERALLRAPELAAEITAFALMAVFAYDTAESFDEAMDLKELLETLSESGEARLQRLGNRVDAVVAFTAVPDMQEHLKKLMELRGKHHRRVLAHLRRNPTAYSEKYAEAFRELREYLKNR